MADISLDKSLLDPDWLLKFNILHKDVFHRLLDYRNQDAHKLLTVLEECNKSLMAAYQRDKFSEISPADVEVFIESIINVYCHCIESIKVSRAVRKFLKPWEESHDAFIKQSLIGYMIRVTEQSDPPYHCLVAVSNLLEQNCLSCDALEKHLVKLLSWVKDRLGNLVSDSSKELSQSESSQLYTFVKIVLQVFQSCAKQVLSVVFSPTDKEQELVNVVLGIVGYLFNILSAECYPVDCTILTGTTFAMFMYLAQDVVQVISMFWYVYRCIYSQESIFSVTQLVSNKNIKHHMTQYPDYKLGVLALIKGMIACGTSTVFGSDSHIESEDQNQLFIFSLFPILSNYCVGPLEFHYQAFTVLHLWYLKLLKLTPVIPVSSAMILGCDLTTLKLAWLNWDSPIEDVAQLSVSCLKCLIDVMDAMKSEEVSTSTFCDHVLMKLILIPWYIKGKYRVLSILLPYLNNAEILEKHPVIQTDLFKCMSTNHLAPSAGDVYKSFLLEIRKKSDPENYEETWSGMWLNILQDGLLSSNLLTRSNVNHYWVSATVKVLPLAGVLLQSKLALTLQSGKYPSPRQRVLNAYIAVSKTIRINMGTKIQNFDILREALYSSDEDVRSEAIGLVCISLKKAEPLSTFEVQLLKEVIPFNIKIDSAPFRQHLSASLKKLLVRVRDSSLAALKSKQLDTLETSVEFIQWLYVLCINNLTPGACYQRRKTCLEILQILLQTFVYDDDAKQRKSYTPATAQKLEAYVKEKKMWQFFSAKCAFSLLHCILDGADEIQELACHLLMKYPFWPLSEDRCNQSISQEVIGCHLLAEAMNLCNSPKSYESQSGALLCKIIFTEYVVKRNWIFSVKQQNGVYHCDLEKVTSTTTPTCFFLQLLKQQITSAITASKQDIVAASRMYPIHGFVSAISRCLTETPEIQTKMNSLLQLIQSLVKINMDIIDTMLAVMAKDTGTESCPSFAEIGEALESWISESQTDYSQSTSLSYDHQLLLSWCWVNIKESCLSLGSLSLLLLRHFEHNGDIYHYMKSISETFCGVLTRCRHRGVIEGCRTAFIKYCSALFNTQTLTLNQLPKVIMEESFVCLRDNATTTSITRKSAGLPVIIQSIVTSEKKLKKNTLLKVAVDTLFELSSLPLSDDVDDRHDLPQVHGLNILKSLFGDASLSESLMPYISNAVVLVVEVFSSQAWAVRNAATRLFSSLITRIFGQRKTVEETSCNTLSILELSALYPALPRFLLEKLKFDFRTISCDSKIDPSLFLVLTLLASLGPSDIESYAGYTDILHLRDQVMSLLASPVYYLRQLASTAYITFVPMHEVDTCICNLIFSIPQAHAATVNFNQCHGVLLCVEKLFINHSDRFSADSEVIGQLLERSWLYCGPITCDFLASVYLDILQRLCKLGLLSTQQVLHIVHPRFHFEYGNRLVGISRVRLLFTIHSSDEEQLLSMITTSMSDSLDVKMTCLELLKNSLEDKEFSSKFYIKIQTVLMESLSSDTYPMFLSTSLRLIVDLHMYCGSSVQSKYSILQDFYQSTMTTIKGQGCVASALLECGAVCIQNQLAQKSVNELVTFCSNVRKASEVTGGEDFRIAAARCLLVAGTDILKICHTTADKTLDTCVVQLTVTCLNLIQDDEMEIRDLAVQFISSLDWPTKSLQYKSLQSNVCLQLLSDYLSEHFYGSAVLIQELSQLIYRPGEVRCKLEAKDGVSKQLFEVEDNSFYDEKVFTGVWLYTLLMKMVKRSSSEETSKIDYGKCVKVQELIEDVHLVKENIDKKCKDKPVINSLCDPSVFSSVLRLFLLSKFAVQVDKQTGENGNDVTILDSLISNLEQDPCLEPLITSVMPSGDLNR